ncbi:hypothetical protein TL16_g06282 [Triparma laevis f. inornata]|uniref:Uncharacterized protein n=1 Tax=Triparma laevis f. inornata TaxID=1714386 RepID=A0A9W7AK89_9STRA|nr:hypothetical protein TL16_g06282 [Triparma laevis f. inornata]
MPRKTPSKLPASHSKPSSKPPLPKPSSSKKPTPKTATDLLLEDDFEFDVTSSETTDETTSTTTTTSSAPISRYSTRSSQPPPLKTRSKTSTFATPSPHHLDPGILPSD